jgi:hypothetical protein
LLTVAGHMPTKSILNFSGAVAAKWSLAILHAIHVVTARGCAAEGALQPVLPIKLQGRSDIKEALLRLCITPLPMLPPPLPSPSPEGHKQYTCGRTFARWMALCHASALDHSVNVLAPTLVSSARSFRSMSSCDGEHIGNRMS